MGVIPSLSAVSRPEPFSTRIFANSRWPLATANARGDEPSISQASMADESSVCSSKSLTISAWPFIAPKWTGVYLEPVVNI